MKKKICLSILLLFISLNLSGQDLKWTGTENNDFFNENNWQDLSNGLPPQVNTLNPNEEITHNLYLTCNTIADGVIILADEKYLYLENGELIASKIAGLGIVNFNENAHVIFEESLEFNGTTFHFNSSNSSIFLCSKIKVQERVMKNKTPFLTLEKSLVADIINLIIIGISLFLYGLVTFCF